MIAIFRGLWSAPDVRGVRATAPCFRVGVHTDVSRPLRHPDAPVKTHCPLHVSSDLAKVKFNRVAKPERSREFERVSGSSRFSSVWERIKGSCSEVYNMYGRDFDYQLITELMLLEFIYTHVNLNYVK